MKASGRLLCLFMVTAALLLAPSAVAAQEARRAVVPEASRFRVRWNLPSQLTVPGLHHPGDRVRLDLQAVPRRFGRAGVGLGAGLTLGAVALTGALTSGSGNACTGSGDYLEVCRLAYIGGTALSGGLGALIGGLIRREAPSGRARSVLLGSAIGSVVPFVLSLPVCGQSDPSNPEALCGVHGMTNPGITIAGAAAGGLIGYLLGRASDLRVTYVVAPVPTPRSGTGLEIKLATWPFGRIDPADGRQHMCVL